MIGNEKCISSAKVGDILLMDTDILGRMSFGDGGLTREFKVIGGDDCGLLVKSHYSGHIVYAIGKIFKIIKKK